jgi:hypothetical protein
MKAELTSVGGFYGHSTCRCGGIPSDRTAGDGFRIYRGISHTNGILAPPFRSAPPENAFEAPQRRPPAMAAPLVGSSSLPQRLAGRQDTALRGLDMQIRMGADTSLGFLEQRPRSGRFEKQAERGTISNGRGGRFQLKGANYAAAARTSLMDPRWRGRRRTRISLGGGGLGQWEVGWRPA